MNYLVFLNSQAGELEKILSGTKSMVVKVFDPARTNGRLVRPGDNLYFLRGVGDYLLQVKASAVRAVKIENTENEDLSHVLKEMQPRLQLTEDQYNYWSAQKQVILVEFSSAHKIGEIKVARNKIQDRSDWIAFENFDQISE